MVLSVPVIALAVVLTFALLFDLALQDISSQTLKQTLPFIASLGVVLLSIVVVIDSFAPELLHVAWFGAAAIMFSIHVRRIIWIRWGKSTAAR